MDGRYTAHAIAPVTIAANRAARDALLGSGFEGGGPPVMRPTRAGLPVGWARFIDSSLPSARWLSIALRPAGTYRNSRSGLAAAVPARPPLLPDASAFTTNAPPTWRRRAPKNANPPAPVSRRGGRASTSESPVSRILSD